MCFGRVPGGQDSSHSGRERAQLGQDPQTIELVVLSGIVPHEYREEADVSALHVAPFVAPQRGDPPTTANSRKGGRIHDCTVDEPVGAIGNEVTHLARKLITPGHHVVGPQGAHQLFVVDPCVGDDLEADGLGELHRVAAHRAGGARDRQTLPGLEGQRIEGQTDGSPFMGIVAASASLARAGLRTTESAGTTTRSA
jgi:hypothetical protein